MKSVYSSSSVAAKAWNILSKTTLLYILLLYRISHLWMQCQRIRLACFLRRCTGHSHPVLWLVLVKYDCPHDIIYRILTVIKVDSLSLFELSYLSFLLLLAMLIYDASLCKVETFGRSRFCCHLQQRSWWISVAEQRQGLSDAPAPCLLYSTQDTYHGLS